LGLTPIFPTSGSFNNAQAFNNFKRRMEMEGQERVNQQRPIGDNGWLDRFLDRPFGGPPQNTALLGIGLLAVAQIADYADMPGYALISATGSLLVLLGQRGLPPEMAVTLGSLAFIIFYLDLRQL
jgi:hypothetical protein